MNTYERISWPPETHATTRPSAAPITVIGNRKILVPTLIEAPSRTAMAVAARLARTWSAHITLLHVIRLAIAGEERGIERSRLMKELAGDAAEQLKQIARNHLGNLPVEIMVREGQAAAGIVAAATRIGANSIIMEAKQHPRWLGWLHRNTARNVLKNAPCPVWLLAQGETDERATLIILDPIAEMAPMENLACQWN